MRKRRIKQIIKQISALFAGLYLIILIIYYFELISTPFLVASFYGGLLNLVNSIITFLLLEYSYGKSNKVFLISVLGGMSIRLFALLMAIFIFLGFLNIDKYGFILTFFIFYFILIVLEINYLRIRAKSKEILK